MFGELAKRARGFVIHEEGNPGPYTIKLSRFSREDNESYIFMDPGTPELPDYSYMCSHCHRPTYSEWYGTVHQKAGSSNQLLDLYSGAASGITEPTLCEERGGVWVGLNGVHERFSGEKCYFGENVLDFLNPACSSPNGCASTATEFGQCSNCHVPGMNGKLGSRNILQAEKRAHDSGVFCDVCHRVESVDLENENPGVGGALKLLRPSDVIQGVVGDSLEPLFFGPRHDVPTNVMGAVQRDHYRNGKICGGCHEYHQTVPEASSTKWPGNKLPVHSTYSEWLAGPFGGKVHCNACHLPPMPHRVNGAVLKPNQLALEGLATGFIRTPGTIRSHGLVGPRTTTENLLALAASMFVDKQRIGDELVVNVKIENRGAGHAIPTGEPSRSIFYTVDAFCGDSPIRPKGGVTIPGFIGYHQMKKADEDWTQWESAKIGQVVRVVRREGSYIDYTGYGPFGDGRFTVAEKGLQREVFVGESTILSMEGSQVTLDAPLPAGEIAYLGDALSTDDTVAFEPAGRPGFGFARVLVDRNGKERVSHFRAIDIRVDNRLLPAQSFEGEHRFAGSCETPTVHARLWYRRFPGWLMREKMWSISDTLMMEVLK